LNITGPTGKYMNVSMKRITKQGRQYSFEF